MKLAVVIVHYNSSSDLDRCLESLVACAPRQEHEIIIVDNASRDDGLAAVHKRYPDFTWIFSSENTGYSRGVNLGMSQVKAEYYLVLNPDIVVQPGALDRVLEFADENPRAGMVGPQLLNEDGSIQESCRRFYTLGTLLLRRTFLGKIFPNSETVRRHLMQDFDHQSSRPVDWVLGGCILVRRSAMDRTGPMDERFFLYFEDVDWCYRMWQAGFEVQYTPDARFMHRHRRDSAQGRFNKSFWMHLGSLISFYEKWGILVWLLKKWRDPLMVMLLWLADMAGLTAAFGLAYGTRGLLDKIVPDFFAEALYPFAEYRPLLMFSLLVASLTFLMTGRYRPGGLRNSRPLTEHLRQIGAVAVLLMASSYLGHLEVISRAVLLLFIPFLFLATWVAETGFRRLWARLEKGRLSLERTLLVGQPSEIGAWLADSGRRTEFLIGQGIDLAGYLETPESQGAGLPPLAEGTIPWLGPKEDLLEVVQRYRISQVVFWQHSGRDTVPWMDLGGLRRLRVRLRWQVADAWLLAARTRTEVFGEQLSAVQQTGSGTVIKSLTGRLASVVFGLFLGVVNFPGWLVMKAVLVPRGAARFEQVHLTDIWGHNPQITLALDAEGKPRSLFWQWPLALSLLQGRLGLWGPRASLGGAVSLPDSPGEMVSFWNTEPAPPGLTGAWAGRNEYSAAGPGSGHLVLKKGSLFKALKRLFSDPGGFTAVASATTPTVDPAIPAPPGREVD